MSGYGCLISLYDRINKGYIYRCADAEDSFACLLEADASDLETANAAINAEAFFGTYATAPVVDEDLIVERPLQTISRGRLNGVSRVTLRHKPFLSPIIFFLFRKSCYL